jgi:hypothetical protein
MRINLYYSNIDNHPVSELNSGGWIDNFAQFLKIMVGQLSGRKTEIGRSDFEKEIITNERIDLVFVSNDSLRDSSWESGVNTFLHQKIEEDMVDNVFLIIKSQLIEHAPEGLSELSHVHEFYRNDGRQYHNFFNKIEEGDFWFKLGDLAYDIFSGIKKDLPKPPRARKGDNKVFLSECTPDLAIERMNLKRDLENMGFEISSREHASNGSFQLKSALSDALDRSDISIHLIGSVVTEDKEYRKSLDEIQIDLAIQRHMHRKLINTDLGSTTFVWINPDCESEDSRKEIFRNALINKIESHDEIETFRGPIEEFKGFIESRISKKTQPENLSQASFIKNADPISVYFIFDKRDEMEAAEMISKLRRRGFTVFNSIFNVDILAVRHVHIEFLRRFDVAVLFSLSTSSEWMNMKMLDVLKAPGLGRTEPVAGRCIITTPEIYESLNSTKLSFDFLPFIPQQSGVDLDVYFNRLLEEGIIHY